MLHQLIVIWFGWVQEWGYWGVFILMAMESSIFPVPSEIVMPPAAYWASQGQMTLSGVILAGTAGSWFGSAVTYWVAQVLGKPFVIKYGKYFLMPPSKIAMAEAWVSENGVAGVFLARLLPVIRHLISIPAGIFKMPFGKFSVVTTLGAGIWCTILAWFGQKVLGDSPQLMQSPEELAHVIKAKLAWFVGAVVVLAALFIFVKVKGKRAH